MTTTHATANLLAITPAVREARLDWLTTRSRRIADGYEWAPAEANARKRMLELARATPKAA